MATDPSWYKVMLENMEDKTDILVFRQHLPFISTQKFCRMHQWKFRLSTGCYCMYIQEE